MSVQETPTPKSARTQRRTIVGVVAGDRMAKTIKILVHREFTHPKYEKRIRRRSIYVAHDEKREARLGDTVEIRETRRISKTKTWALVRVLKKAAVVGDAS